MRDMLRDYISNNNIKTIDGDDVYHADLYETWDSFEHTIREDGNIHVKFTYMNGTFRKPEPKEAEALIHQMYVMAWIYEKLKNLKIR